MPRHRAPRTRHSHCGRRHVEKVAKLGSNENPLGPSPALRRQFPDIGELARLYPDPQGRALCTRLAGSFDVGSDQVILGNGSEDLIAVICRSVVRPGDTVATLYPSFPLHAMRNPPVPPGFWRGVNLNQNALYVECFVDELAHEAGIDPLEFRRKLLVDHPKHLAVLEADAERVGWGKPAENGIHRGLAQIMASVVLAREPGRHTVYRHAFGRQLGRQRFGQSLECSLGGT